ncbi:MULTISPECIES: hypothetical protein [unclassified Sphingobacterium]|uniref:hypothetical protein n=1 Tax=unclassified Sphingobacterium TaxID=2609468 RepID=UPI0025FB6636|nr:MULTISPECIES: hypothetical protein [unclassified Sphingobacterium]
MFNLFSKRENLGHENNFHSMEELSKILIENRERLFVFLNKLEVKMQEFTEAALPELEELKIRDEREYGIFYSGIQGQLNSIIEKAEAIYQDKIETVYQHLSVEVDSLHPMYHKLTDFRITCSDRLYNDFHKKYNYYREQLEHTNQTDYEVLYQKILDEHARIKDRFRCQQCGDTIHLTKIYFITTYLTCPSCQTKNTFRPGTLSQRLEDIGRGLAEQRTRHLLEKYHKEQENERILYHRAHELKLKLASNRTSELQQQLDMLEEQRQQSLKIAPKYYQEYQRAMFDEWKVLVPDLAEQTENFYQGLQRRKF